MPLSASFCTQGVRSKRSSLCSFIRGRSLRTQALGNFTYYDYTEPEDVPEELHSSFGVVVADPPYLSEECLQKTAVTMRLLAKDTEKPCLYLLTGAVMREPAAKLLGLRPATFRPQHKNKLGNEFCLFTNVIPSQRLGGWDTSLP